MKLDIIFAGAAKDEQQEKLLLDLLSPLGIDKHTMTEAKSDRKAMESALVTALRRSDVVLLIGGLGSGRSDFTTPLLCEGLGLREEICPAALEQMKKRYKVEEEALSKEDLFKVKIPAGSHPFLNRWGDCPAMRWWRKISVLPRCPMAPRNWPPWRKRNCCLIYRRFFWIIPSRWREALSAFRWSRRPASWNRLESWQRLW